MAKSILPKLVIWLFRISEPRSNKCLANLKSIYYPKSSLKIHKKNIDHYER